MTILGSGLAEFNEGFPPQPGILNKNNPMRRKKENFSNTDDAAVSPEGFSKLEYQ